MDSLDIEKLKSNAVRLDDLEAVCALVPDDVLLMSRMHCHMQYLSSIVLAKNEDGGLIRMFLAWDGHDMMQNDLHRKLPLGIHDHRYPLKLKLIYGRVLKSEYEFTLKHKDSRVLHKFEYISGQMNKPPTLTRVGAAMLRCKVAHELFNDVWITMPAKALHNVKCHGFAAWLVYEGAVEQEVTSLYTPHDTISTEGLYHPFSTAASVREHVASFVSAARDAESEIEKNFGMPVAKAPPVVPQPKPFTRTNKPKKNPVEVKNKYADCPIHQNIIKSVLHRCVDLGWRDNDLAKHAGISTSHWSEIRSGKKSPSIEAMFRITMAVGLELNLRMKNKNLEVSEPNDLPHHSECDCQYCRFGTYDTQGA